MGDNTAMAAKFEEVLKKGDFAQLSTPPTTSSRNGRSPESV